MMTVDEAAKALGLKSYDTALPQDWAYEFADNPAVKAVADRLGVSSYPPGQFVWSYDGGGIGGRPVPLTPEATEMLAAYEASR